MCKVLCHQSYAVLFRFFCLYCSLRVHLCFQGESQRSLPAFFIKQPYHSSWFSYHQAQAGWIVHIIYTFPFQTFPYVFILFKNIQKKLGMNSSQKYNKQVGQVWKSHDYQKEYIKIANFYRFSEFHIEKIFLFQQDHFSQKANTHSTQQSKKLEQKSACSH